MQLTKYLLLLFPYKTITIPSSLSKPEVMARLSDRFIPEAVLGEDNFWNPPARYEGHDLSNHGSVVERYCFQIDGPFGNKRWTLSTEIKIASTSQGSHLKLRLTLSLFNFFCAIFVLVFYGIAASFWIKLPFWEIIILQELFMYGIIIFAFNYEVEALIKLLKDTLQKPTSPL
jgi:hypothetical protein